MTRAGQGEAFCRRTGTDSPLGIAPIPLFPGRRRRLRPPTREAMGRNGRLHGNPAGRGPARRNPGRGDPRALPAPPRRCRPGPSPPSRRGNGARSNFPPQKMEAASRETAGGGPTSGRSWSRPRHAQRARRSPSARGRHRPASPPASLRAPRAARPAPGAASRPANRRAACLTVRPRRPIGGRGGGHSGTRAARRAGGWAVGGGAA